MATLPQRYCDTVFSKFPEIYEQKSTVSNISTCINIIDKISGGINEGTLTTILGFTGSGKTTYAVNIVYEAIKDGKNCVYFSLEIAEYLMYANILSRYSFDGNIHIPHFDIKRNRLENDYKKYLFEELYVEFGNTYKKHLHIIDETQIYSYTYDSFLVLLNDINNLFITETGKGIELVVVDHIQLLKFDEENNSKSETYVINCWVDFFRKQCINFLGKNKQVPIILLSQANRDGWKNAVRNDGNYQLTALADANELERASSLVISVFLSDALKCIRKAKVQVLKCRDGQTMEDATDIFADLQFYAFGDKAEKNNNSYTADISINSLMDDELPELGEQLKGSIDTDLENLDLYG